MNNQKGSQQQTISKTVSYSFELSTSKTYFFHIIPLITFPILTKPQKPKLQKAHNKNKNQMAKQWAKVLDFQLMRPISFTRSEERRVGKECVP